MDSYSDLESTLHNFKNDFVNLLRYSMIEVAVMGALGLGIVGYNSHVQESAQSKTIPLSFSEVGQLIKESDKAGHKLSTLNMYLPKVNDAFSKIFEANNESNKLSPGSHRAFARELENHMELNNIYRFNLRDLLQEIPSLSQDLLIEKKEYVEALNQSIPLVNAANNSWSENHRDNYHTEYYTETESYTTYDSDGNSQTETREVTKSREVYDDTDHYFNYTKKQGELTAKLGLKFLKEIPELKLESIYVASITNADGEYAAEKSRKFQKKTAFDEVDYLNFSRNWFVGSTILTVAKDIEKFQIVLKHNVADWDKNKKTAKKNYHYNTYSHWHDGPKEFQSMEHLEITSTNLKNNLNEFVSSIIKTRDGSKELENLIDSYIRNAFFKPDSISSRTHTKHLNNQRDEILDNTKELYFSTFKKGFGICTYNYGRVVLKSLAGLVIGAAIGLGINYLGDKTNMYNYLDSKKPLNKQNRNRRGAQNDMFRDYRRGLRNKYKKY